MGAIQLSHALAKAADCLDVPRAMRNSKTSFERVTWSILLIIAACVTVSFIVTLGVMFTRYPVTTLTEVASTTNKELVTDKLAVSYCPSNWPNATKIRQLNISYDLAVYMIRILEETALTAATRDYYFGKPQRIATVDDLFDTSNTFWAQSTRKQVISAVSWAVLGRQRNESTNVKKTLNELHQDFLNLTGQTAKTFQDFYISLANDVMAYRMTFIRKIIKHGRVCHEVSRNNTAQFAGEFPGSKTSVEFRFNHIVDQQPPSTYQFSVHTELNIGPVLPSASSVSVAEDYYLWTSTYDVLSFENSYFGTRLDVWLRNVERRDLIYSSCIEPGQQNRFLPDKLYEECVSRCIDTAVYQNCSAQVAYDLTQTRPPCSYERLIQTTDDSTWYPSHAQCIHHCTTSTKDLQLCESWEYVQKWVYTFSSNGPSTKIDHQVNVWPVDIMIIHEKHEYTIDKLLGDVGGSLGLLLGASVMSVVEMLFLVINCIHGSYVRRRSGSVAVSDKPEACKKAVAKELYDVTMKDLSKY